MSDRLEDAKHSAEAGVEELDTKAEFHIGRLREKYGFATVAARFVDLVALAGGLYLIVEWGTLYKLLGVVLILGGLFGFVSDWGDSDE